MHTQNVTSVYTHGEIRFHKILVLMKSHSVDSIDILWVCVLYKLMIYFNI